MRVKTLTSVMTHHNASALMCVNYNAFFRRRTAGLHATIVLLRTPTAFTSVGQGSVPVEVVVSARAVLSVPADRHDQPDPRLR